MKPLKCISGTALKLMAMVFMLCDHLWASGLARGLWLTVLGRLALPIFAFQIAEGYVHTHNFKKYVLRILLFALLSEIPFNYMMAGTAFFPLHQNVMFTFLLALLLIRLADREIQKKPGLFRQAGILAGVLLLGFFLGFASFTDYYGFGVVTVILFWATRDKKWGWAAQLAAMWLLNWVMIGGQAYVVHLGSRELWIPIQGFAILALIPIWLYNGKRGPGGRALQYFGYAFYPVHIALIVLFSTLLAM